MISAVLPCMPRSSRTFAFSVCLKYNDFHVGGKNNISILSVRNETMLMAFAFKALAGLNLMAFRVPQF